MTFIEAKTYLIEKHFEKCESKKDAQEVMGNYSINIFGEDNSKKAIAALNKITKKHIKANKLPTPDALRNIFNEFGDYVQKKKLTDKTDFNATEFVIMTIIAAEIEENFND